MDAIVRGRLMLQRVLGGCLLVDLLDVHVEPGQVVLELAGRHVAQPLVEVLAREVNLHLLVRLLEVVEVRHGRLLTVLLIDSLTLHDLTHIGRSQVLTRRLSEISMRFTLLDWEGG